MTLAKMRIWTHIQSHTNNPKFYYIELELMSSDFSQLESLSKRFDILIYDFEKILYNKK